MSMSVARSSVYTHDRGLARVLVFEALMSEHAGRYDDALEYQIDAMRMGSDIVHEEPLAAHGRVTCEGIGRGHTWEIVGRVTLRRRRGQPPCVWAPTLRRRLQRIFEVG